MRNKKVLVMLICIIAILSVAQTVMDYKVEEDFIDKSALISEESQYCIFIEIEDKTLYLLKNGRSVRKFPIASGKSEWPSPLGFWHITNKDDWGEGFGGRWLGLDVPWGNYGIHGTTRDGSIGRAASHGCIRMHNNDIKKLYDFVSVGTPVVILNGCFGPFGTGFKNKQPGDRGSDIMAVQKRLNELGYYFGRLSGIYEDDLKEAIYTFQRVKGLRVKYTLTEEDYIAMGFRQFE